MAVEFLGKGWKFPINVTTAGQIERSEYEACIQDAIWLILSTAKGERVMRPDFGCGIHDLVFRVNNATTTGLIGEEVRDALVRWEPRIDVLNIEVTTTPGKPYILAIRIEYRVRSTNNVFNLVYPFYLERSTQ